MKAKNHERIVIENTTCHMTLTCWTRQSAVHALVRASSSSRARNAAGRVCTGLVSSNAALCLLSGSSQAVRSCEQKKLAGTARSWKVVSEIAAGALTAQARLCCEYNQPSLKHSGGPCSPAWVLRLSVRNLCLLRHICVPPSLRGRSRIIVNKARFKFTNNNCLSNSSK